MVGAEGLSGGGRRGPFRWWAQRAFPVVGAEGLSGGGCREGLAR